MFCVIIIIVISNSGYNVGIVTIRMYSQCRAANSLCLTIMSSGNFAICLSLFLFFFLNKKKKTKKKPVCWFFKLFVNRGVGFSSILF